MDLTPKIHLQLTIIHWLEDVFCLDHCDALRPIHQCRAAGEFPNVPSALLSSFGVSRMRN